MICPHCGKEIEGADFYELGEPIEVQRAEKPGVVLSIRLDGADAEAVLEAGAGRSLNDFGREALVGWASTQLMNRLSGTITTSSFAVVYQVT